MQGDCERLILLLIQGCVPGMTSQMSGHVTWALYKADTSLRRKLTAGPKDVRFRDFTAISLIPRAFSFVSTHRPWYINGYTNHTMSKISKTQKNLFVVVDSCQQHCATHNEPRKAAHCVGRTKLWYIACTRLLTCLFTNVAHDQWRIHCTSLNEADMGAAM